MADLSIVTGYIIKWIINPLMWLILILIFVAGILAILFIRKRRALKYEGFEITDYGINTDIKCGWFGSKWYLKGLWTTGEERMFTSDGEEILNFSEEDFIEINGKRGVPFMRDPLSRRLFPAKISVDKKSKALMAEVPPRSYIDAAVDILNDAAKETSEWKEKVIQFAAWALVVIFSLVAIIVIVQYVRSGQKEAADLLLQAGQKGAEACKEICREAVNIATSKATGGAP